MHSKIRHNSKVATSSQRRPQDFGERCGEGCFGVEHYCLFERDGGVAVAVDQVPVVNEVFFFLSQSFLIHQ